MDKNEVKKFLTETTEGKVFLESLVEEHSSISGLKNKNSDLIQSNKKFKVERDSLQEKIAELEGQLEEVKAEGSKGDAIVKKENEKLKEKIFALEKDLEGSKSKYINRVLDSELDDAILKADISPKYRKAVKALLKTENDISFDDTDNSGKIGDKSIFDFVSNWAKSDGGKDYVLADNNLGGGAKGSSKISQNLPLSEMTPEQKLAHAYSNK